MSEDTIAAICTPPGRGAIGIVRLSGPESLSIAGELFKGVKDVSNMQGFSAAYGRLEFEGRILDEIICLVMRAPGSYTREDVVEFQCHGGPVALAGVLDAVLACGARLAQPGEFTRRAFLHGRIDLAQAEAVSDMIMSQTSAASRSAADQLQGRLSVKVNELHEQAVYLLALVEAGIDFSDEDIEAIAPDKLSARLLRLKHAIDDLLEHSERGRLLREGLKIAIVGRPNVGKSTLMNALLRASRVIVTPIPGTTRDVVEDVLDIQGIPARLSDTAGIRDSEDPIEQAGVERSRDAISAADLALLVLDTSEPLSSQDRELLKSLSNTPAIIVLNKSDLPPAWGDDALDEYKFSGRMQVSALLGQGIEELEHLIAACVCGGEIEPQAPALLTNVRHRDALRRARQSLETSLASLESKMSDEFIALDLREAALALSEVLGQNISEAVLDIIFSRFCIGK